MKILFTLLIAALALNSPAAVVRYSSTNIWGEVSTNAVKVTPIGAPINANGTFVTRGLSFRIYPDTNGTVTTNLSAGNYLVTNSELRTNICFAVPTDLTTNVYLMGDLAISGFNTYNYTPGVRSLVAGNGISLSATTGNITITGTGTINYNLNTSTNLHGSNGIQNATISTNKMDATAYAAFIGGGSEQTNISYLAVTNAPWLTNQQSTQVLLTNVVFGMTNAGSTVSVTNFQQNVVNPTDGTGLIANRLGSGYLWQERLNGQSIFGLSGNSVVIYTNLNAVGGTITGNGSGLTNIPVVASGFNGNLTTSDDTLQEVAQKVDDLALGAGGSATNAVTTVATNGVNLSTAATNLQFAAGLNFNVVGSSNDNGTIKIVGNVDTGITNKLDTDLRSAFAAADTVVSNGVLSSATNTITSFTGPSYSWSISTNGYPAITTNNTRYVINPGTVTVNYTNGAGDTIASSNIFASIGTTGFWSGDGRGLTNLPGVLYVDDFGAIAGDGSDDTVAFQAAVDALPATGGEIRMGRGQYRITTLRVDAGTTLTGEGGNQYLGTLLYHAGVDTPTIVMNGSDITLRDFAIYGTGVGNGSGVVASTNAAVPTARFKIENVSAAALKNGFVLTNAWIGTLDNTYTVTCSNGIAILGTVNAVRIIGGEHAGNTNGIYLNGTACNGNVISTTLENNRIGLYATNAFEGLVIDGSYFELNTAYSILAVGDPTTGGRGLQIVNSDFTLTGTGQTNIYLKDIKGVTIGHNYEHNSTTNAFLKTDSTVSGLVRIGNKHTGTVVDLSLNPMILETNIVSGAGFTGLIGAGNVTNAAGSAVAYRSDTNGFITLTQIQGFTTNGAAAGDVLTWTNGVLQWTNAPAGGGVGDAVLSANNIFTGTSNRFTGDLSVVSNLYAGTLDLTTLNATNINFTTNWNAVKGTNIPITALWGSGGTNTAATNGTAGQILTSAANGGAYWSTAGAGDVTTAQLASATNNVPIASLITNALIGTGPFLVVSNNIVVRSNIPAGGAGDAVLAANQTWTGVNTLSNDWKMDAASALYLSNLTTARVLVYNTADGVTNTGATGPLLGTGSAAAFSDINALAPSFIVTNNNVAEVILDTARVGNISASGQTLESQSGSLFLASEQSTEFVNIFGILRASNGIVMPANQYFYPSNVTASRVLTFTTAGGVTNVGVTGPLLGTGAAAAFSDINSLAPSAILTNGGALGTPSSGTLSSATGYPAGSLTTNNLIGSGPFLVVSNNLIVMSNAPAGSGGGFTGNPNQFSVSAGSTNIVSGVPLTNVNFYGIFTNFNATGLSVNGGIWMTNYTTGTWSRHTNGGFYLGSNTLTGVSVDGSAGKITLTNVLAAGNTPQLGLGTNSVAAANSVEVWNPQGTKIISLATNGTLTVSNLNTKLAEAVGYCVTTNLWATNTIMGWGTNLTARLSANTAGGITGVGGTIGAYECISQLTILASGDVTFTNPAAFYCNDFADTRVITNGNTAVISLQLIPNLMTNMAIVQFR